MTVTTVLISTHNAETLRQKKYTLARYISIVYSYLYV